MTVTEMLGQSVVLTILGVAVVFSFLLILVIVISQVSRIILAMGLEADRVPASQSVSIDTARPGDGDRIIAAISAAVNEYRKAD